MRRIEERFTAETGLTALAHWHTFEEFMQRPEFDAERQTMFMASLYAETLKRWAPRP